MLKSQNFGQCLVLIFEEPQGSESLCARLRSARDNLDGGAYLPYLRVGTILSCRSEFTGS
jgi:hypothetical protein